MDWTATIIMARTLRAVLSWLRMSSAFCPSLRAGHQAYSADNLRCEQARAQLAADPQPRSIPNSLFLIALLLLVGQLAGCFSNSGTKITNSIWDDIKLTQFTNITLELAPIDFGKFRFDPTPKYAESFVIDDHNDDYVPFDSEGKRVTKTTDLSYTYWKPLTFYSLDNSQPSELVNQTQEWVPRMLRSCPFAETYAYDTTTVEECTKYFGYAISPSEVTQAVLKEENGEWTCTAKYRVTCRIPKTPIKSSTGVGEPCTSNSEPCKHSQFVNQYMPTGYLNWLPSGGAIAVLLLEENDRIVNSELSKLVKYFGEIDTPEEAILLAYSEGYDWSSERKDLGAIRPLKDGGFQVILQRVDLCPRKTERFLVNIGKDGKLVVLRSMIAELDESICVVI